MLNVLPDKPTVAPRAHAAAVLAVRDPTVFDLAANPGLASRFNFTLTFTSYTADEIVAIGRHIAGKEKIAIAEEAWPMLHAEATRFGDGGDNVAAVGEREDRNVDPEHVGHRGLHEITSS